MTADAEGNVVAEVQIRRFIETPGYGRVDCASVAERCLLGMGAISNYDRSGGVYIRFEGSPDFPVPSLSVPGSEGGLTPGQEVQVQVSAWVPGRLIRLQQCAAGADGYDDADSCETLLDTRAEGPYLWAKVPPGQYKVQTTLNGTMKEQRVTVGNGQSKRAIFVFPPAPTLPPEQTSLR